MKSIVKTGLIAIMLLMLTTLSHSCSNMVEDDTITVLVTYNQAISAYNRNIAEMRMVFDNNVMTGLNMYQGAWNNVEEEYRLDSLLQWFYEKHGEREYNKLMIKVNDNFYSKMNK